MSRSKVKGYIMEDDHALNKWKAMCPKLFEECDELGISAFLVLDALEGIEQALYSQKAPPEG